MLSPSTFFFLHFFSHGQSYTTNWMCNGNLQSSKSSSSLSLLGLLGLLFIKNNVLKRCVNWLKNEIMLYSIIIYSRHLFIKRYFFTISAILIYKNYSWGEGGNHLKKDQVAASYITISSLIRFSPKN